MAQLPDPPYRLPGAAAALEGAQALVRDAELLAAHGSYGRAIALLILGAEEATKALTLHVTSITSDLPGAWDEVFWNHRAKHQVLYFGAVMVAVLGTIRHEIDGATVAMTTAFGLPADEIPMEDALAWLESYFTTPERTALLEAAEAKATADAAWWQRADRVKQRGFYVEFQRGRWHSPALLGESEYIQVRERVLGHLAKMTPWVGRTQTQPLELGAALERFAIMQGLMMLMEIED